MMAVAGPYNIGLILIGPHPSLDESNGCILKKQVNCPKYPNKNLDATKSVKGFLATKIATTWGQMLQFFGGRM